VSQKVPIVGESCHYCAAPATTRDHIVPKALGGKDGAYNIVPSCMFCNTQKADDYPTCTCPKCQRAVVAFEMYWNHPTREEQASWAS